ncbi:DUF4198 domain-containing protein [Erythrobacter litoralis]|uniref:ABC-type Co2+ transport system, periplasmic component n=1 Tax=Erythrobacter litoralis (strain HTCC2594) TaxID=314225 RepID=Q2N5N8_ERYLH|nr:DUF4198 domain-containing protein [Erythrobacter litoralis]ABC65003.1 hypothetical protein ELI_14555 [Erythrobacter litoralis HTCC2594]
MIKRILLPALLACPAIASAHTFWLAPESYQIEVGEIVTVDFQVGDAAENGPWGLYWERVVSLRDYGPDGISDHQGAIRETVGEEVGRAALDLNEPGTHVVAFESNPSASDLDAEAFNSYVDEEGLHAVSRYRNATATVDRRGTELYSRRSKALIQVGDTPTDNVTLPIGQTLEIVPLQNPYALGDDRRLTVQILFRGAPLTEGTLHVANLAGSKGTTKYPTDENGMVELTIPEEGRWLLDVVWAVPAPNEDRADFFTVFSSLSFGYD